MAHPTQNSTGAQGQLMPARNSRPRGSGAGPACAPPHGTCTHALVWLAHLRMHSRAASTTQAAAAATSNGRMPGSTAIAAARASRRQSCAMRRAELSSRAQPQPGRGRPSRSGSMLGGRSGCTPTGTLLGGRDERRAACWVAGMCAGHAHLGGDGSPQGGTISDRAVHRLSAATTDAPVYPSQVG
jgi:hypothetical protein